MGVSFSFLKGSNVPFFKFSVTYKKFTIFRLINRYDGLVLKFSL